MDDIALTGDEAINMGIAVNGNSMLAIGHWEQPVKALAARGLMNKLDDANYVIAPAGREALEQADRNADRVLADVINKSHDAAKVHAGNQYFAEQTAQQLADTARLSAKAMGHDPGWAARKWSELILKRALELLK